MCTRYSPPKSWCALIIHLTIYGVNTFIYNNLLCFLTNFWVIFCLFYKKIGRFCTKDQIIYTDWQEYWNDVKIFLFKYKAVQLYRHNVIPVKWFLQRWQINKNNLAWKTRAGNDNESIKHNSYVKMKNILLFSAII